MVFLEWRGPLGGHQALPFSKAMMRDAKALTKPVQCDLAIHSLRIDHVQPGLLLTVVQGSLHTVKLIRSRSAVLEEACPAVRFTA